MIELTGVGKPTELSSNGPTGVGDFTVG